jgi:asparagine synthase (glutamine-hydrolysing)
MLARQGQGLSAYTAVPMAGASMEGLARYNGDEGAIASVTAAGLANVEHVLVGRDGRPLGQDFEILFNFLGQPARCLYNSIWFCDILRQMGQRGERVLLTGEKGNMTISYEGGEMLAEFLVRGQWPRLVNEVRAARRQDGTGWPELVKQTLKPLLPGPLLQRLRPAAHRLAGIRQNYTPLRPEMLAAIARDEIGAQRADARGLWRRDKMGFGIRNVDPGPFHHFVLGAFGIDKRDPTCDRRVVELAQSLPAHVYLRDGRQKWIYRQAFAGRVPGAVLAPAVKPGLQSADWMYRLDKGREQVAAVLDLAKGNEEIESLFDMDALRRQAVGSLDFSKAYDQKTLFALRFRFTTAVAAVDFIMRAQ